MMLNTGRISTCCSDCRRQDVKPRKGASDWKQNSAQRRNDTTRRREEWCNTYSKGMGMIASHKPDYRNYRNPLLVRENHTVR